MAIQIKEKYKPVLVEALNDYLYRVSLELNKMKGDPMTPRRKELSKKQRLLEELRSEL